jgi:pheromone shutdown protein TraB
MEKTKSMKEKTKTKWYLIGTATCIAISFVMLGLSNEKHDARWMLSVGWLLPAGIFVGLAVKHLLKSEEKGEK